MKLLCWMHRKFRQNSQEALRALVIGQSSVDDQHQYFQKTSYGGRGFNNQQNGSGQTRKSFAVAREDDHRYYDGDEEEEAEDEISDLFHGFLAIGTLGSPDQMMPDPATPTFTISNITEKETEATENEFKLINDELEKVLLEDTVDHSSSRNSHVSSNGRSSHVSSNGRSSHGSSVITLSGKPDDVAVAGSGGGTVCPLQDYLFGSAIDMSATAGRKENRTSLGELFQRSKESGDHEKRSAEKDGEKSAINIVKKKLKKKMLHASSRSSSTASGGGDPSAPSETKLNKILQMFHRKVHPESPEGIVKNNKVSLRKKQAHEEEGDLAPDQDQDEDQDMLTLCPERARFLKQKIRRYRSQSNPFDSNNAANREQWIKTDADYLVLEL